MIKILLAALYILGPVTLAYPISSEKPSQVQIEYNYGYGQYATALRQPFTQLTKEKVDRLREDMTRMIHLTHDGLDKFTKETNQNLKNVKIDVQYLSNLIQTGVQKTVGSLKDKNNQTNEGQEQDSGESSDNSDNSNVKDIMSSFNEEELDKEIANIDDIRTYDEFKNWEQERFHALSDKVKEQLQANMNEYYVSALNDMGAVATNLIADPSNDKLDADMERISQVFSNDFEKMGKEYNDFVKTMDSNFGALAAKTESMKDSPEWKTKSAEEVKSIKDFVSQIEEQLKDLQTDFKPASKKGLGVQEIKSMLSDTEESSEDEEELYKRGVSDAYNKKSIPFPADKFKKISQKFDLSGDSHDHYNGVDAQVEQRAEYMYSDYGSDYGSEYEPEHHLSDYSEDHDHAIMESEDSGRPRYNAIVHQLPKPGRSSHTEYTEYPEDAEVQGNDGIFDGNSSPYAEASESDMEYMNKIAEASVHASGSGPSDSTGFSSDDRQFEDKFAEVWQKSFPGDSSQ
ncbi:hypothetical protein CANCADRAFT_139425 [Tortispora caseinolytica NRRL Y-17796]|uniref:Uncharacterized protein n=1 Tax=Tortispora caseinolytica NRRL Y-17796 TaxID=767744 RepID=A0A1E4TCP9_9ASCO|nr:hypothetical protein CANCADRAFT_139425 [Tortispora caseinolytica NRRL Y-17796]